MEQQNILQQATKSLIIGKHSSFCHDTSTFSIWSVPAGIFICIFPPFSFSKSHYPAAPLGASLVKIDQAERRLLCFWPCALTLQILICGYSFHLESRLQAASVMHNSAGTICPNCASREGKNLCADVPLFQRVKKCSRCQDPPRSASSQSPPGPDELIFFPKMLLFPFFLVGFFSLFCRSIKGGGCHGDGMRCPAAFTFAVLFGTDRCPQTKRGGWDAHTDVWFPGSRSLGPPITQHFTIWHSSSLSLSNGPITCLSAFLIFLLSGTKHLMKVDFWKLSCPTPLTKPVK